MLAPFKREDAAGYYLTLLDVLVSNVGQLSLFSYTETSEFRFSSV
jgi:hypothetical protein